MRYLVDKKYMGWHPRYICHCGYDHRERRNMNKEIIYCQARLK